MHAHTLEYRQFRWFRVVDGLFEWPVACAREYRPGFSYAKLSRRCLRFAGSYVHLCTLLTFPETLNGRRRRVAIVTFFRFPLKQRREKKKGSDRKIVDFRP